MPKRGRDRGVVSGFFFQAEDGIRDYKVTGVQTCALPISGAEDRRPPDQLPGRAAVGDHGARPRRPGAIREGDRKSTRLNSSHLVISYAVFCLKKKNEAPPHSMPYDIIALAPRFCATYILT